MGDLSKMNIADWLSLAIAIIITIIVTTRKNPHQKGSQEYETLRYARTGLILLIASYGGGLFGYLLALTSLTLGIVVIAKGRTLYGVLLIIGSIYLQIMSKLIPLKCIY